MTITEKIEKLKQYLRLVGLIFLIVIFVSWVISFAEKVRHFSPTQPVLTVETDTASTLNVSVKVISTVCEDAEKIDFSLVELSVNGGKLPYDLTITNSESELSGPYPILKDNSPVRITVYGGDYFTAVVRSSGGEIWSGTIGLPSQAEVCKATPTSTLVSTAPETITDTPIPTNTEIIFLSPTSTSTVFSPVDVTATETKKPRPGKTNTPESPNIIVTTNPQPSKTPDPQPTNPPQPTDPPPPQPTVTPINPNPRQCEDGIDNDGDGLIDFGSGPQNDPDCRKPSDPKEGH